MQRVEQALGYVLHRRAFSENSVILECFCREYGRIGLLARGARGQLKKEALSLAVCYRLSYAGSGELCQLRQYESTAALDIIPSLSLALLYVNELLMHILPKADPHPTLFDAYQRLLNSWPHSAENQAAALRRFEHTVLEELGYGIDFLYATNGRLIRPDVYYRLDVEAGFIECDLNAREAVQGAAILSLNLGAGSDHSNLPNSPPPDDVAGAVSHVNHALALRKVLKTLLSAHLHGKELQAWSLMSALKTTQHALTKRTS